MLGSGRQQLLSGLIDAPADGSCRGGGSQAGKCEMVMRGDAGPPASLAFPAALAGKQLGGGAGPSRCMHTLRPSRRRTRGGVEEHARLPASPERRGPLFQRDLAQHGQLHGRQGAEAGTQVGTTARPVVRRPRPPRRQMQACWQPATVPAELALPASSPRCWCCSASRCSRPRAAAAS